MEDILKQREESLPVTFNQCILNVLGEHVDNKIS